MMIGQDTERVPYYAWGVSLALHALITGIALVVSVQVKPIVKEEVFRWDVALVTSVEDLQRVEELPPAPTIQPTKPTPVRTVQSAQPVEPDSDMVMTRVATQYSPEMIHPTLVAPKPESVQEHVRAQIPPVEPQETRKEEIKKEEVTPQKVSQPEPVQEIIQAQVQSVDPQEQKKEAIQKEENTPQAMVKPETEGQEQRPAPVAETMTPSVETNLSPHTMVPSVPTSSPRTEATEVASAAPLSPEETAPEWRSLAPVREGPVQTVTDQIAAPSTPAEAPVLAQPPVPLVAKTAPVRPATKADNAWLAESLGRRIREVTRYPSSARLNGTEGKVVLRVVLRADGHLADVTVHRSSGHEVLDRAAMETVRLACPIHMKRALSAPEVAVYVPIVYSLAG